MKNTDQKTLEDLLLSYARDSEDAFPLIYQKVAPGLERYLRRRLKGDQETLEVMQQVFMRLHQYRVRYDSRYLGWQWIYVIANSELSAFWRSQSRHKRNQVELKEMSQNDELESNTFKEVEHRDEVELLISDLDEKTRHLLGDKFIDGQTYEEIAARTGKSAQSLRKKISRVLEDLKRKWEI